MSKRNTILNGELADKMKKLKIHTTNELANESTNESANESANEMINEIPNETKEGSAEESIAAQKVGMNVGMFNKVVKYIKEMTVEVVNIAHTPKPLEEGQYENIRDRIANLYYQSEAEFNSAHFNNRAISYCQDASEAKDHLNKFYSARFCNFPNVESVKGILNTKINSIKFINFLGDSEKLAKVFLDDEHYEEKKGSMEKVEAFILPKGWAYGVIVQRLHKHHLKCHISLFRWKNISENMAAVTHVTSIQYPIFEVHSSLESSLLFFLSDSSKLAVTGDKRVFCFNLIESFEKYHTEEYCQSLGID